MDVVFVLEALVVLGCTVMGTRSSGVGVGVWGGVGVAVLVFVVSYRNGIRPARPLSVSVVQSGVALAASPVSAAMAAMLTLTDTSPYSSASPRSSPSPSPPASPASS